MLKTVYKYPLAKSNMGLDFGVFQDGDAFPEFSSRVLEVLRQSPEDKQVNIARAQGSLTFLANLKAIPIIYFPAIMTTC